MTFNIQPLDYHNQVHASALIELLDAYSRDPMGGGQPLDKFARDNLVAVLGARATAFGVIAFLDKTPAGLINCFEGFSTFACKPLANIHDVIVAPEFRGKGLGLSMLQKVEHLARERGCIKLTLEVLEGNPAAQGLYRKFGFAGYRLVEEAGSALFWQKYLEE